MGRDETKALNLDDTLSEDRPLTFGLSSFARISSTNMWRAFIAGAISYLLLSLTVGYPLVLPGGAIVSGASFLRLVICIALATVAGFVAPRLARTVPAPLAIATCAAVPSLIVLSMTLWCVPATAIMVALGLACGAVTWAKTRKDGGKGTAVAACVTLVACLLGILVLLPVGEAFYLRCPHLLSSGFASVGGSEVAGIHGGIAQDLARVAEEPETVHSCSKVAITPFHTNFEGIMLSWDKDPGGDDVLVVSSEYVADFDSLELTEMARDLLRRSGDAASLYTRWLDGRLWMVLHSL